MSRGGAEVQKFLTPLRPLTSSPVASAAGLDYSIVL